MERRALLATMGVSVGAVSLAGCLDDNSLSDSEQSSPEETLEQWWAAIEAEDLEAYRALYHSDSPERDSLQWDTDEWWDDFVEMGLELHHREITSRSETDAVARERVDVEGQRLEIDRELRTDNGQWKLWDQENYGRVFTDTPEDFEECPWITWTIENFPAQARLEAETALEEGYYETDEELYLPHLFDLSESYFYQRDRDSDDIYYQASVEEDGEVSRLTLSEAIPTRGNADLRVKNRSLKSLSVTLAVTRERDGAVALEWSGEVPPEDSVTVGKFERLFGDYTAEVERGEQSATRSWDERNDKPSLSTIRIDLEETDADGGGDKELVIPLPEPRPHGHPPSCEQIWEGSVE